MKQLTELVLCFIFLLLISCNNDVKTKKGISQNDPDSSLRLELDFPDTIHVKTWVRGKVNYRNEEYTDKDTYVFFHVLINDSPNDISLDEIKKNKDHITFVDSTGTGTYNFETGSDLLDQNYLHGVIEDIRFDSTSTSTDSITKIIQQTMITQPVYVKARD